MKYSIDLLAGLLARFPAILPCVAQAAGNPTKESVSAAYRDQAPFAFKGEIKNVSIEVSETQPFKK